MLLDFLHKDYQKNKNARLDFLIFFNKLMVVMATFYTLTWVFLEAWYCFGISIIYTTFVYVAYFLTKQKKYRFFVTILLSISFIFTIQTVVFFTNGLQSPFFVWLFVTIISASALIGKIGTVISTLMVVLFFLFLNLSGIDYTVHNELDASIYDLMYTLSVVSGSGLIGLFAWRLIFTIEKELTKQAKLRKETEKVNTKLVAKREEQNKLLSIVSHELRTPAATLSMLLNPSDIASKTLDIHTITNTMNHLMDVLDDMRMVKEPEVILETPLNNVYVRDVLEDALSLVSSYIETKDLVVTIHEPTATKTLCVVRDKLVRQIAMNIIKNCVNHSNATQLAISIGLKEVSGKVEFIITFSDNGQGIPKEKVPTLFTPFVKGYEKSSGSGLGLHLSREFARKGLNGDLYYITQDGNGATFELVFLVEKATKEVVRKTEEKVMSEAISLAGLTVLLVEDNMVISMMTQKLLEAKGASVLNAKNGEVALAMYKDNPAAIDFVLTDIFMPKLNGYELTAQLRNLGFKGEIIGCSAASIGEEANKLIAAGANKVFVKPLQIEDFLSYIQEHILGKNA
ncbi:MAG: response regulator [Polaribacter sp.]|jgi:signal transduction histidine kinase/CheY-like chemotaxis protein